MNHAKPQRDRRLLHGIVLVLFLSLAACIPALRPWPWVWFAPLVGYFLLVASVPTLRRSLTWLRFGRVSSATFAATLGIMTLTLLLLVVFQSAVHPDVRPYRDILPIKTFGNTVIAGVVFTIVNATLEEFVFRGVLFDAVRSQWSMRVTLIATAALFGLGHLHGYPPGPLGACLATLFGFAVGLLRLWTGGLALPILAHMAADATICGILVNSAVR